MVFVDVVLSKICIIEKSFGFVLLNLVVAGWLACWYTLGSSTLSVHFW